MENFYFSLFAIGQQVEKNSPTFTLNSIIISEDKLRIIIYLSVECLFLDVDGSVIYQVVQTN